MAAIARFSWEVAAILPVVFLFLLAVTSSGNLITDLIVYKTCAVSMLIPEETCAILHDNSSSDEAKHLSATVQGHIAPVIICNSVIRTLIPMVLSLFLGPWSDKFGRKVLLLIALTGFFLNYLTMSLISLLNLGPYWILLSTLCGSILGGRSTIFLIFMCHISDLSRTEDKAWNLALMDTAIYLGIGVGLFAGPYAFKTYGYYLAFGLSAISCLLAILYSTLIIRETVNYTGKQKRWRNLLDLSLIGDMVRAMTEKRENFNRKVVWLSVACIMLISATQEGGAAVEFLFSAARLGWDIADFSIYSVMHLFIISAGSLLTLKIGSSMLGISDNFILILGSLSGIICGVIKAYTFKSWHLYTAGVSLIFYGATIPIVRSIIAKNMPEKDLSKAFSFIPSMEMIIPFASESLYILIYTNFLPPRVYPCPVWFVSPAVLIVIIILSLIIDRQTKKLHKVQSADQSVG